MYDSTISLTILVAVAGVSVVLFWPHNGLFWRWRRGSRSTERVLMEDALKYLYDLEYRNRKPTLDGVAGNLHISLDRGARLMQRLETYGLVTTQEESFRLTPEGRSYALRIIRVHRLWERYLADETGISATEWHSLAEKKEHLLTPDQAEELAEQIGDPRYDPHGDPIPTPSGKLPPRRGIPLTDLTEGDIAEIIHIEDEPQTVYAQLIAEGLHPGRQVRMLYKSPERLQFEADGDEVILAPVVAANITVVQLKEEEFVDIPHETLASLRPGESGKVIMLSRACRGQQRRRLMDLGIIPGTVIAAEMRSPSGDPTAYSIRGASIGLRDEQARLVQIERLQENGS